MEKCVSRGPNKGDAAIVSDGGYGNNIFYGFVRKNGEVELRGSGLEYSREGGYASKPWLDCLVRLLESDLHGMIKEYGTKSGRCCFCKKTLTDPKSVSAGFGKTCASNYGMIDEYRAARE